MDVEVEDAPAAFLARWEVVSVEPLPGAGLRLLDLGTVREGAAFMDGWTEIVRPAWRCGRVVDRLAYAQLSAARGTAGSVVFPSYRDPAARLGA